MNKKHLKHLNLLVDTNVWLDYFLGRKESGVAVEALQKAAKDEAAITTTPSIMKDVFYLVCAAIKRRAAESGGSSEVNAKAINEIGWACISTIQSLSIMLSQGFEDHLNAVAFRSENKDYEDNLLLATAKDSKIDFIITNDRGLLKNKIVPTLLPEEYLKLD